MSSAAKVLHSTKSRVGIKVAKKGAKRPQPLAAGCIVDMRWSFFLAVDHDDHVSSDEEENKLTNDNRWLNDIKRVWENLWEGQNGQKPAEWARLSRPFQATSCDRAAEGP